MKDPRFIHLHLHTEYSLVDGIIRIDALMKACTALKMPAVALTDRCNLFGAVKFYKAAIAHGIKPIIGSEILIANEKDESKPFSIVLLCCNQVGYKNLTRIISRSYLEGQTSASIPTFKREWLKGSVDGLIALSGGIQGDVAQAILNSTQGDKDIKLAEEYLKFWLDLFPQNFYLEITRTGIREEENHNRMLLELAKKFLVPVVATNNARFIEETDFDAHEARVSIHEGYILTDSKRPQNYSANQYLKSMEEMAELFSDIPEALTNSVEISKRCNLNIILDKVFLPDFPTADHSNLNDYLRKQSQLGLAERIQRAALTPEQIVMYEARLKLELDVIINMGFSGYFLIVADFIKWARDNDVPVGPGRGSGAGSLVAYALKITNIDPIPYDLLFERFLNPERISMPDFDIDFCMEGRDRVIDYVAERYGRESVSQIITFGTMAARAVVRDVGRVLGFPYGFVDKLAKLIPFELGITLAKAIKQEELLLQRYQNEEEVKTLLDLAKKLEGIVRNAGKHAGGVVIAPTKLTDFTPLYCEANSSNMISQFDKDDVEAVGLVKFDFLGLRTLTIINWTLQTLRKNSSIFVDIDEIPLNDEATFALLKNCQTTGVFQLESRGMKDLVKRLKPDTFEDIVALVALFRPGPLQSGMVDDFINRKHGLANIHYLHPLLEPILRPTYGVILYQEQVMQIAQVLAGYTLGQADLLRRAMGKKKASEMAKQRTLFYEGAQEKNISAKDAHQIFDLMEMFAGYGFNKSHSVAYAALSYQTAWLKTHFPAAFLASVLSAEMDHTEKVVIFIAECKQASIKVIPPDINKSFYKFTVVDDQTILYGLGAIKGAGWAALENIITLRETSGAFKSLFDLCSRVDLRKVNRRVLESLIRAGACDSLGAHRASLLASLEYALRQAEQRTQSLVTGQHDLFADFAEANEETPAENYVQIKEWIEEVRLKGEKDTLGHYISGHPLDRYAAEIKQITTFPLSQLQIPPLQKEKNKTLILTGVLTTLRSLFTKRGDRMAFISLADQEASVEMAIFSDVFSTYRELLVLDQSLVVEVEATYDELAAIYKLNAKRIWNIEEARAQFAKFILLKISKTILEEGLFNKIKSTLTPFCSGEIPICIEYQRNEATAKINLDESWRVTPKDQLMLELKDLLGEECVTICY